jgi:hypothetical protein
MWPFKRKHKCDFTKPIASLYVSFHTRDILFECSCGKRNIERVTNDFDTPFPIETTMHLTRKELNRMAEDIDYLR